MTDQPDWPTFSDAVSHLRLPEYDVIYSLGEWKAKYYPSNLTVVLEDMITEADLFNLKEDHVMTISGYPVLQVKFVDGMAFFYDPLLTSAGETPAPLNATGLTAYSLEKLFRQAAASVRNIVLGAS